MCNNTLEILCNFINKFRKSCKILEDGLLIVKNEDYNYENDDLMTEVELDIKTIKAESNEMQQSDDGIDDYEELFPLKNNQKVKREPKSFKPIKKEQKSQKPKYRPGNRTNKIASSILEGNCVWNGDKWW